MEPCCSKRITTGDTENSSEKQVWKTISKKYLVNDYINIYILRFELNFLRIVEVKTPFLLVVKKRTSHLSL